MRASIACFILGLSASCSPPPPVVAPEPSAAAPVVETPPLPPEPEPVETGQACAKATVLCGGGACELKLKNECDAPLTCDAFMLVRCKAANDFIEASGRGRETFPAKTEGQVTVDANCTMGTIVQTSFSELKCK